MPGFVVNESLEITEFLGVTGPYVDFSPGRPDLTLRKVLRLELRSQVLAAIAEAAETGQAERAGVTFLADSTVRHVSFAVRREEMPAGEIRYRILFDEISQIELHPAKKVSRRQPEWENSAVDRLRRELETTRETFTAILAEEEERYRRARNELSASYEPLQELARRLEITNAELEAVREELEASLAASQEAASRLRDSEECFERFMEHLPGRAWIKDLEGRYIYANQAAQKGFQTPGTALYGRTDAQIFPHAIAEVSLENDRRAMAGDGIQTIETSQHEDGTHYSIVSKFPIRDKDGKSMLLGGIAIDITESKQAANAEAMLAAVVNSSTDSITSTNLDGIITSWNRGSERIYGYAASEAIGQPITLIIPPDRIEEDQRVMEQLLRGERIGPFDTVRVTRDGRRIDVSVTVSPVSDALGRPMGISRIAKDISARRQAEDMLRESEARFRSMADHAPVMIWISGTDKLCTWFNKRWLEFVGRPMEEEIGNGWTENVHADDLDRCVKTYNSSFQERATFSMEYRLRRHDGEYRWVLDTGIPLYQAEGNFTGYIGSCVDITERKLSESALREADSRKDEFLATLGHELRNPLAAISMGAALLQSNPPPERRAWTEQMVVRQVNHLQRLVDDLLDVSRVGRGKVELRKERVALRKALEASTEAVQTLMAQQRHELSLSTPREEIYVEADPARLEQMIVNLLTNAAKYTPEAGRIRLSAEEGAGEVIIRCKDTGLGLPPEMLEAIFEPFVQFGRPVGRTTTGLGIGLTLARKLAELHGGALSASSAGPGKGSEFVLRLPAHSSAAQESLDAGGIAASPTATQPCRILLVDNNRDLAESLAEWLRAANHDVVMAHDGKAAIAAAAQQCPEIVLLEIGLPDMDGFAVAEQLRAMPELKHVLIASMSGRKVQDSGVATGIRFDAELVKPFVFEQLSGLLEIAASRRVSTPAQRQPLRVLLIEDNQELAELTSELLRDHGEEVEVAFNGKQGAQKANRFQPQVVICDLKLPDQNGFEVARRIREQLSPQPPLLIGVTADDADALQKHVGETPFDSFLSKPLRWNQFNDCIESLLSKRSVPVV
jgi:PAS domain S-box-containing protein